MYLQYFVHGTSAQGQGTFGPYHTWVTVRSLVSVEAGFIHFAYIFPVAIPKNFATISVPNFRPLSSMVAWPSCGVHAFIVLGRVAVRRLLQGPVPDAHQYPLPFGRSSQRAGRATLVHASRPFPIFRTLPSFCGQTAKCLLIWISVMLRSTISTKNSRLPALDDFPAWGEGAPTWCAACTSAPFDDPSSTSSWPGRPLK